MSKGKKKKKRLRFPMEKQELIEFWRMSVEETDRGCVLTVGALAETHLEGLLRAEFKRRSNGAAEKIDNLFTGFGQPPLGSFYIKSELARVLGLIDEFTHDGLDVLRDIRNEAAHPTGPFALEKVDIDRILSLVSAHKEERTRVRESFAKLIPKIEERKPRNVTEARRLFELAGMLLNYRLTKLAYSPEQATEILSVPILRDMQDGLERWKKEKDAKTNA